MDHFRFLEIFSPTFDLLGAALLIWFSILLCRVLDKPNYIAFIAATLFPLVLGMTMSIGNSMHYYSVLSTGGFGPGNPNQIFAMTLLPLVAGSLLTCIFYPLGILAFLISIKPSSAEPSPQ